MASTREGADVNVQWETTRVNFWHLGAIAASLVTNTALVVGVYYTLTNNDGRAQDQLATLSTRVERLEPRLTTIEGKIPQFEVIGMQIQRLTEISAQNAKSVDEANKRMDRIVDSLNNKLDVVVKGVADLTTEVRVVQSLQRQQNGADRTRFPIVRP